MSTPDNAAYFHAAYLAAGVVYTLYALSLWVRWRRVRDRAAGGGD